MKILQNLFDRIFKNNCSLFDDNYVSKHKLEQYKTILDNNIIVSKTDADGKITYVNKKFIDEFKTKKETFLGRTHTVIKCKHTSPDGFRQLWNTIKSGKPWSGALSCIDCDNNTNWNNVNIFPIFDEEKKIIEYIAIRTSITEIVNLKEDISKAQKEMIITLGSLVEGKDEALRKHVYRVAEYSYILATAYGLEKEKCNLIRTASPVHDAGKICIPDEILHKPGKLDADEWEIMKTHAEAGYELFKDSKLDLLQVAASIAHEHHEKWDGTGYPRGLKGDEITIEGRITAIADVFDALSIERPYKKAWSIEKIEELIKDESGKAFDPKLVEIYFENKDKFINILTK